jgi:hypothetical protein
VLCWVPWYSFSLLCWSLDLGICFLHFPLIPVLICCWGENGFHPFFHLPIIPLGAVTVPVLCVIEYYLAYNSKSNDIQNGRVRRKRKQRKKRLKNREPKKLTGSDSVVINSELNKHVERKRKKKNDDRKKIPGSDAINFQS